MILYKLMDYIASLQIILVVPLVKAMYILAIHSIYLNVLNINTKCLFFNSFFIVQLLLSWLFPIALPCPVLPCPSPLLQSIPPIAHAHESSIHVPWLTPYPSFPQYSPLPTPLDTVRLFFISMSLVLFCSFVYIVD